MGFAHKLCKTASARENLERMVKSCFSVTFSSHDAMMRYDNNNNNNDDNDNT